MKLFCYPKLAYYTYLVLSIVCLAMAFLPWIIWSVQFNIYAILWAVIMAILCILSFIGYLWNKQTVIITNKEIRAKNCFGTLVTLEIDKCAYQISDLPTYHSWASHIKQKWICIYDIGNTELFAGGCANNAKHKRIQIIFNEENLKSIEALIKPME